MAYDPTTLLPAYVHTAPAGLTLAVADHDQALHELDRQELRGLKSDFGLTAAAAAQLGYTRLSDAAGAGLWVPTAAVMQESPIINGGFLLWQRGTSFAAAADGAYTADRWRYGKTGAMVHTVSQSATAPAVAALVPLQSYSLLVDCTTVDSSIAAGDFCIVEQRIEGYNWLALAQYATAWSFWHNHTKVGTYCVALVNSGGDRSCVATYTQAVTNTWELATVTFPASPSAGTWDYTTGIGARLIFPLTAGSTFQTTAGAWQTGLFFATSAQVNACDDTANNFRLWGVQPARGTAAIPYVHRPIGLELLRALRYYTKTFAYATAPAQATGAFANSLRYLVQVAAANANSVLWQFPVPMRVAPTPTAYSVSSANTTWRNFNDTADSGASSFNNVSESRVQVINAQVAGDGVSELVALHAAADAEL